jgi:hypothetical protein
MYTIVKGKHAYAKEGTTWERVRSRNLDKNKNIGCQETSKTETQENKEKIKEKNTQYPKREIIPSGFSNSITRKISLWLGENYNRQNENQESTLISSMLDK